MKEFNKKRVWGPEPFYPYVERYPYHYKSELIKIVGPCSIESRRQVESVCGVLQKSCGVTFMRGGVYRAGTYPRKDFGLKYNLLRMWSSIAKNHGFRIIVEVLDIRLIEKIDRYADAFQVGARHMQDYALLKELSSSYKTVTLKRHPGSKLDEFLGAAEYLCKGKCKPILIERGSSTHMNHVRWDLSVTTIATIKRLTGLPILVDASHGTGRRDLVIPCTLAGIASGADGYLMEIHPNPEKSISDSEQAVSFNNYMDFSCVANDLNSLLIKHSMR